MKEQKNYGLIRRMDDFGRILLPKEMRQFLDIRENDSMEICLVNRGIYLEKYQPLKTLESLCDRYLSALFKHCGTACAICDSEYVISSRGIQLSTSLRLSETVRKHIRNLDMYNYSDGLPVSLFSDGSNPVDTIRPIGTREKPLGAVILLHYHDTTPEEKSCTELVAGILTELIQNQ